MAANYEIRIKNTSGALTQVITQWSRLTYTRRVNGVDFIRLELRGDSAAIADLVLDAQIEVWRSNQAEGIPSYLDCEGFVRTVELRTDEDGNDLAVAYGAGYDDLLARRIILYPADSAETNKSGPGETVIKEFVDQNAGPGATFPPRLLASGVTTGLTIEADAAAGATWTGARSYAQLLGVCQEIGLSSGVDFGVVGTGLATFEFRAKAAPWGTDRTTTGLDTSTGLNGAGVPPAIFSLVRGNMGAPVYVDSRASEVNAVIVMGQGLNDDRTVIQRTDASAIADSPWNRRELGRNGNYEDDVTGLNIVGDTLLAELGRRQEFSCQIIETPTFLYGKHWFHGDQVTARYKTVEVNKKLVAVTVTRDQGQEILQVELADAR